MKRRIANAYLSSLISISLVLLLVGVASLLLVNAGTLSNYFKENMQVSVVLKPEVSDSDALALEKEISTLDFIRSTEFISREQGVKEMEEMLGEGFLSVFETVPIPASVEVTLMADYVSADSLAMVQKKLSKYDQVDSVDYENTLVDALNSNLARISLVLGVFILLLLFISFVLINNTVRLSVFSNRFTIHTMNLVGATKSFIRGPFLVKAMFQGLFAAIIAIAMLTGVMFALRNSFPQLFGIFSPEMLLVVMGIVVASGVILCVVSTYFVVGKLVTLGKDELYA